MNQLRYIPFLIVTCTIISLFSILVHGSIVDIPDNDTYFVLDYNHILIFLVLLNTFFFIVNYITNYKNETMKIIHSLISNFSFMVLILNSFVSHIRFANEPRRFYSFNEKELFAESNHNLGVTLSILVFILTQLIWIGLIFYSKVKARSKK